MARNIVILADGTGQHGGVFFDENRSNIYKLYRATRIAPDSTIDPAEQFAFYDPGIGTLPAGMGLIGGLARRVSNLVRQATGLGLTNNIVQCYAAIIRNWSPGDLIFIFGFSRGAYTARCLAAVIDHCGVPTRMRDGTPLRRDRASSLKLAHEAVTKVYQHVGSPKATKYVPQRKEIAARFRQIYASGDERESNASVHFIGVFDTVAAVARPATVTILAVSALMATGAAAWALWALTGLHWPWMAGLGILLLGTVAAYLRTHLKWARGLKDHPFWSTVHLNELRMRFYNTELSTRVGWARHALAIDEHRAAFDRVPWGDPKDWRRTPKDQPQWLEQLWFAGNHSDVGGSYPDAESRLSDAALQWMVGVAQDIPNPLKINNELLRLYPSVDGMQHDETRALAFRFARKMDRTIKNNAILHPTVLQRFTLEAVQHFDEDRAYRPRQLKQHDKVKHHYQDRPEQSHSGAQK